MKRIAFLIPTVFLFVSNAYSQTASQDAISIAKSIKTESFFTRMGIISSDAFEGREAGSKGYNLAADYVVDEIKKIGLKPGGTDGSYYQPVAFESRKIESSSLEFLFRLDNNVVSGEYGMDVAVLPSIKSPLVNMNQEVVFAGYGLEIPELGINDFKGVDVKGKTVIITIGLPDNIEKKVYRKYLNPLERIKSLEKKGVSAVIFCTNLGVLQNVIFKQVNKFFQEPWFDFKDSDLNNPSIGASSCVLAYSKKEFIKEIFELNGLSFKKTKKSMENGEFKPFTLKSHLELNYKAKIKNVPCKNIVAILPGSDPTLSSEYVVLSAHLDHMGIGKAVKKDSIYNGAWDNASGSSTLLSIAETYKQMPAAPKRSIIFLWVTAEEKGLLGSHYYARKPTVPQNKIIADMSLDMSGGLFVAKSIIPMGYKMSNLSQAVDFAAGGLNLLKDTTSAEENEYFERSDHFSFVSAGIPSLFLFGGMDAVDPDIQGQKVYDKWDKKIYHSPFDDMNQHFTKEAFLQGIQVNFLISWFIANEMDEIKWKKDSEQYKKYIGK